jgi:hypothetical protein
MGTRKKQVQLTGVMVCNFVLILGVFFMTYQTKTNYGNTFSFIIRYRSNFY